VRTLNDEGYHRGKLTADALLNSEPGFDVEVLFAPSFGNRNANATNAMLTFSLSDDADDHYGT
jgi:hypothetical protein